MRTRPSYLGAFVRHPANRVAMLAAGCAGIFATIPLGWSGLALVGVVTLGSEILAALGICGLPSFRASVDRQHHQQQRNQRRERLLAELAGLGDNDTLAHYQHMYQHMHNRVLALHQTVQDAQTTLTPQDVDKLEDLTVDYLGLSAVSLSLRQRKDHVNEDMVLKRIAALQTQLQNVRLSDEETRQLRSTLAQYDETLQRTRRLAIRRSALEATLLAMPDKMEEVYQLVITAPYASDMGDKLEESLSRLRIAEEVSAELENNETPTLRPVASARSAENVLKA